MHDARHAALPDSNPVVRNGFYWSEFDPTYYVVAAMAWLGLAWNLQPVPARIYDEARRRVADAVPQPPGASA